MKRSVSLLVLACGTVALAGCGGGVTNSTPSAGSQAVDVGVDEGDSIPAIDDEALGFADLDGDDVISGDDSQDIASDAGSNAAATFATPIGGAGSVELAVTGNSVSLVDVQLADGWNETNRSTSDDEVKVDLQSATASIDVDAEIESGSVLEIDVDTKWQQPAGTYVESTIAGDVTIVFDGAMVTIGSIDLVDVRSSGLLPLGVDVDLQHRARL
ncbi:MAG: hypothetical protein AAFY28_21920, partial [Actinomycetota bacterium]